MAGAQTVELVLDTRLDAAVRSGWTRLQAHGLPSLADHPHPTNRPHVTVATCAADTPVDWQRVAEAVSSLPVPVRLDRLHVFTGRRPVLVWLVRPDSVLEQLHLRVWRALGEASVRNPLYAPQRWVPHVSLARGAHLGIGAATAALGTTGPLAGTAVAARRYDGRTRTVHTLAPSR
ncbi:2'-5' RNA ligase family protein [Nocardiopsis ansamitocini]|uniref:2'-5' RNA ligase family protein n=1 Tax=Nocardiopsis ansamitocini TaxID=1670832 RepID=A0A9W6UHG3_9ACTN|nr:2'-5' RNA ligase family protein [Nocardiopsis ansamitocini]GLU45950.1 hypothetical protein Nans01_03010 [Nocardiopsis ansamitocini]